MNTDLPFQSDLDMWVGSLAMWDSKGCLNGSRGLLLRDSGSDGHHDSDTFIRSDVNAFDTYIQIPDQQESSQQAIDLPILQVSCDAGDDNDTLSAGSSPFSVASSSMLLTPDNVHCFPQIELFSPSQRSDDSYFDDDHTMDYILCEQSEAHHTSTSYANNLMFSPPSRLPATTEQPQGVAPWLTNALWSPIVHPEGDELESLSIAETPEQHGVSPLPSPYSAAAPSLSRSPNLQLVPLSPEVSQISDIPEDPSLLAPHDAFPEGQSPTSQPAGATPSPSARVLEKRKRDPSPFIPRDDEAEDDADSGDEYIPSLPAGSRQSKRRKTSQTARPSREITSSHSARIGKPKKVLRKTLTLQKKLRCQYCAKTSFTREHDVRRHEERSCSANPNRETEGCECPCCGTVLSRIDSMKRHVRSKHGREYSPP